MKKSNRIIRIIFDVIIFVCVIEGWWFIALPLGMISAWFFPFYFEMIIAGIAYDSLFGFVPAMGILGYLGTIISVASSLIIAGSKRVVRK